LISGRLGRRLQGTLPQTVDAIDRPDLDAAQGPAEPFASVGPAFGRQQRREARPDQQSGQRDDSLFPPGLVSPSSDLTLELRDGLGRLSSKVAQSSPDPLPGLGSLVGCKKNGRAGAQGGGQHRQGNKTAAVVGRRFIERIELANGIGICHGEPRISHSRLLQSTNLSGITNAR
jgi:hypothetical protein